MMIWTFLRLKETPDIHVFKQEIQIEDDRAKYLGVSGISMTKALEEVAVYLKPRDIVLTPDLIAIIPKIGMLNN
jgi:hypothetical protein